MLSAVTSAVKDAGAASPLTSVRDLDPLLKQVGDAHFVLLGEASHGTSDFYTWRAAISKRLIQEKGFRFIAVEGDWPDCYRLNQFVQGAAGAGDSAREVLQGFVRWPTWMWANREIEDLMHWLRDYNQDLPPERRVGFFGIDVYSLWDSLYAVLAYLRKHDPAGLPLALKAFRCFEPYGEDSQQYARATRWASKSCENEVVRLLQEMLQRRHTGPGNDEFFNARQNALVLKNAEAYYRALIRGGPDSWNLRDQHMAATLDGLMEQHGADARGIVWAHNTHIGDARFTDMADAGMTNLGELVRASHDLDDVVLVGFGSFQGTVVAAEQWEAPWEIMEAPPAREGSWERLFHDAGLKQALFTFDDPRRDEPFLERRAHRAIGVVYRPRQEAWGNYVPTILAHRYDAFIHLDKTEALHPLAVAEAPEAEAPETYPTGF